MLPECGFTRAATPDGAEFTFAPSFVRIASLGHPHEIVSIYADLFGVRAAEAARYVLTCLCEQDDVIPLVGGIELDPDEREAPLVHAGAMPEGEQILIAQHLMRHGIAGRSTPGGGGGGEYSATFDVAEYVSIARVHLGLSSADAEALSMSEFHDLMRLKFPDPKQEVPDADEYEATMAMIKGGRGG